MKDWLIIVLAIVALILFFFLLGGIFFVVALHIEKGLPPLIEEVDALNKKRTEIIKKDVEMLSSNPSTSRFKFDQFAISEDDSLSNMRDKQDVTLILVKKVIAESHTSESDLLEVKKEAEDLLTSSEEVFDRYNRKITSYNTFIRFIFTRPFAYLAKKKAYPNIH